MRPSNQTLTIYGGQTFRDQFLFVDRAGDPVDLLGRSVRMQAREDIASPDTKLDLSTDNGTIEIGADGLLAFNLDAEATAALVDGVYDIQTWVYDLEITTPAAPPVVDRVMTGVVVVHPEITR